MYMRILIVIEVRTAWSTVYFETVDIGRCSQAKCRSIWKSKYEILNKIKYCL